MNARIARYLLIISIAVQIGIAQETKKLPNPITVEQVSFDWLGNGSKVTIILQLLTDYGSPIEAERIRIHIPGQKDYIHDEKAGYGNIKDANLDKKINRLLIRDKFKSNRMALLPFDDKNKKTPLLVIFGPSYGCCLSGITIISIENSIPHTIFGADQFFFVDYVDLDNDGIPELIGKMSLTEEFGNHYETYNPFYVYSLNEPRTKKAMWNKPLSKAYNLKHYFGWYPDFAATDVVVYHPPDGSKPRVMREKDADASYEKMMTNIEKKKAKK